MAVNEGTLGGRGTIAAAVIVGTGSGAGAFLQPGVRASNLTKLTISSELTFKSDSTYVYRLNSKKAKGDQVVTMGVTIESGAQFYFKAVANAKLMAGQVFTLISNTAASPISGTFADLLDGSRISVGSNHFRVSYEGDDGNDLTLTVVP